MSIPPSNVEVYFASAACRAEKSGRSFFSEMNKSRPRKQLPSIFSGHSSRLARPAIKRIKLQQKRGHVVSQDKRSHPLPSGSAVNPAAIALPGQRRSHRGRVLNVSCRYIQDLLPPGEVYFQFSGARLIFVSTPFAVPVRRRGTPRRRLIPLLNFRKFRPWD